MVTINIEVNGKDISDDFRQFYTSLEIIDKDGTEADELNFTIVNLIKRPKYEDKIKVWIDGFFYGTFLVQSTTTNHLQELTIKATGTNFSGTLKVKKNRNFKNITLQKLIRNIAIENGLNHKIDFSNVFLINLIQEKESDLHLLNRLAKEYDAIFNIKNNTLVFASRNKSLPLFTVNIQDCISWEITHSDKKIYNSCVVSYRDTKNNRVISHSIGNGEPTLKYTDTFKTEEEAILKATAKLQRANRGTKRGTLVKIGEYMSAGSKLNITDSTQDNGEYTIQTVTTLTNQDGWTITVDFQN